MEIEFGDTESKHLTFGDLKSGDIYRLASGEGYAYLCFHDGLMGKNRSINLALNDAGRIDTYGHHASKRVALLEQVGPLILTEREGGEDDGAE